MSELFEKSETALSSIYEAMKMSISQTNGEVSSEYLDKLTEASRDSISVMKDIVESLNKNKLRLSQSCVEKINEFYSIAETLPKSENDVISGVETLSKFNSLISAALPVIMITNEIVKN